MLYISLKKEVSEAIKEKHGTMRNFIKKFPELKQTESKLSNQLSPNRGCNITKLLPILEALGLELRVLKKI